MDVSAVINPIELDYHDNQILAFMILRLDDVVSGANAICRRLQL